VAAETKPTLQLGNVPTRRTGNGLIELNPISASEFASRGWAHEKKRDYNLFLQIEQAQLGGRQFIENSLRQRRMLPERGKGVRHLCLVLDVFAVAHQYEVSWADWAAQGYCHAWANGVYVGLSNDREAGMLRLFVPTFPTFRRSFRQFPGISEPGKPQANDGSSEAACLNAAGRPGMDFPRHSSDVQWSLRQNAAEPSADSARRDGVGLCRNASEARIFEAPM
jgi:hypothetical protein